MAYVQPGSTVWCAGESYTVRDVMWQTLKRDPATRVLRRVLLEDHDGTVFPLAGHRVNAGPWKTSDSTRRRRDPRG
jgi:hypothetical protein